MSCSLLRTISKVGSTLINFPINNGYSLCFQQVRSFYPFSKKAILPLAGRNFLVNLGTGRNYAKGKDKKKADKGKKKVNLDERILDGIVDLQKMHVQLQKCVDQLKDDYVKNLSLRSTSGSIEMLPVKFDGNDYKLQELAQVIRQNPKSVILNMSSFPQAIPSVLQAIEKSGMNLNPQQDGTKLFIPVPKVTKELRESLAKNAKAMFIKCKGNLKDVQIKFTKSIKTKEKTEGLSTDDSRDASDQITAICDSYITQAEKVYNTKEGELLKG